MSRERSVAVAALGMFLALAGLFVLTNAGRIDIIDGQVRYDVAKNWLDTGRPQVTDRGLLPTRYVVRAGDMAYSSYNGAASVTPMPLMLLSRALPGHSEERDRFAFSMAGPLFGAAVGALLVVGYSMLGLGVGPAVFWAAVTSLATLWWPGSLTVFDQNQHAFFVLAALLLGWQAGRRRSLGLAIASGLTGGLVVTYQENYALILPTLALAVLASPDEGVPGATPSARRAPEGAALARYVAFGVACLVGLGIFAAYNWFRFGTLLQGGRYDDTAIVFDAANPLAAVLSLAASPGKSALLFSPPLLLAALGLRRLFARAPVLTVAVVATSVVHLILIVQVSFFGGDWCWGPRYLLILLPLWSLGLPLGAAAARRSLVAAVLVLGLAVQLMGISVDYQRFFFEHNLEPFFWLDQWSYFKRSQFLSRPGELWDTLTQGPPPEAHRFSPTPGGQITYTPLGPADYSIQGSVWARHFRMFHTLRPWVVWLGTLDPAVRPLPRAPLALACLAFLAAGAALLVCALRAARGWPHAPGLAFDDGASDLSSTHPSIPAAHHGTPAPTAAAAATQHRGQTLAQHARDRRQTLTLEPPRTGEGDASMEAARLDASDMTTLAAREARPVALRAIALAAGAALSLGALYAGGIPYAGYEVHYGRFGWGPFELAFLVNYIIFGTIAVALGGVAVALVAGQRLAAVFDGLDRLAPARVRALLLVALGALAVLITTTRLFLLRDAAITDDEHVYAFMARVFATGGLWAPSPPEPIRAFFDNQFIVNNGKWYGMFFPGHGFLLAAGELLGLVRWVPMLSAVATAALAFAVARHAFGARVAVLTAAGLVVSPYFVMSSATLLAHSTAALFLMLFVYALLRAQDAGASLAWWLVAGLAVGWAGLTRPLAAAAFVVPWAVWVLLRLRRDATRRRVAGAALLVTGGVIAFLVLCAYNVTLAGHPLTTGYHTYSALYRFPVDIGAVKAAAPLPSVYELGYTIERFNFWIFGWPLSLALLPFFRRSAAGLLIFLSSAAVVVAYAISTLPTINATGPAHYAELAAFLVMLSVSGLDRLIERARTVGAERLVLGAVAAAVICACVAFLPVYGGSLRAMSALARLPYDLVAERRLDRAVVFVHGLPSLAWRPGAWVYFHRNPSPDLSDPVLFVKDLGPERNRALMQAMPGRAPFAMGVQDNRLLLVPLRP